MIRMLTERKKEREEEKIESQIEMANKRRKEMKKVKGNKSKQKE